MTFLRNQWYCAGFSDDLKDAPVAVKILGEPIVLYRASGGKAVALQDRCPHRFAPLSKGRKEGDHAVAGHHQRRGPANLQAFTQFQKALP